MGLATWKNAPDGRILKSDVSVAKNYEIFNKTQPIESDFDKALKKMFTDKEIGN